MDVRAAQNGIKVTSNAITEDYATQITFLTVGYKYSNEEETWIIWKYFQFYYLSSKL